MDSFNLKLKLDLDGLDKLKRGTALPEFEKAMEVGAIQFLTWCNTGAGGSRSPAKPPIMWGVLRGSSSAFVNGKYVGAFKQNIGSGAPEKPTPNKSYKGKGIVVGWNTVYAARMHEDDYVPQRDGGPKWIEEHIKADKDLLMETIAEELGKTLL